MPPKVFIVILNWNQRNDTLECLQSLKQLIYPNFEIVIVDNGSTDDSVKEFHSNYPNLQIISLSENRGCAGGRNAGLRFALANEAEYILFLDNDTIVDPEFLTKLVEAGQDDTSVGILGPKIFYYDDPHRIWTAGALIDWKTGYSTSIGNGELDSEKYRSLREVDFVAGCALLAKAHVFTDIGEFDEDYFIYFEETDWCARARKAGHKILFIPGAVLWHKESKSLGGASSPKKLYYLTRNQILFIRKNLSNEFILPASTRLILRNMRYALGDLKHGHTPQARSRFLGIRDGLRNRYNDNKRYQG
ncbi:MAG: glycosyltransferase family 2 protein [Chloroflexota bacterium]